MLLQSVKTCQNVSKNSRVSKRVKTCQKSVKKVSKKCQKRVKTCQNVSKNCRGAVFRVKTCQKTSFLTLFDTFFDTRFRLLGICYCVSGGAPHGRFNLLTVSSRIVWFPSPIVRFIDSIVRFASSGVAFADSIAKINSFLPHSLLSPGLSPNCPTMIWIDDPLVKESLVRGFTEWAKFGFCRDRTYTQRNP